MTPDELKTRMREAGVTVEALAEALHVGERTVYNWRAKGTPSRMVEAFIERVLAQPRH